MPRKDGREWYRSEHVKICDSRMPACPTCGVGLGVRSRLDTDVSGQIRSQVHSQGLISPNRPTCLTSSTSAMAFLFFQSPEVRTPK